jgi:hypothetical protein
VSETRKTAETREKDLRLAMFRIKRAGLTLVLLE